MRSVSTFPRLITLPAVGSIKTLVCDERDRVITCVFCRDLFYLTLKFSGLYKNICLKESKDWRKAISNKIIVKLVTQDFPSSFLSRPVAYKFIK